MQLVQWRRRESNCLGSAASVSYRFHVPRNCILRIQPRVVERARNVRRVTSASTLGYSSIMMKSVDAIYENGKLVLEQPLPLPEHARVRVTIDTDQEREAWLKLSE